MLSIYESLYIESIINHTPHLLKDQPEDGPAVWAKHVAELIPDTI